MHRSHAQQFVTFELDAHAFGRAFGFIRNFLQLMLHGWRY
jgi:hypothetical protein